MSIFSKMHISPAIAFITPAASLSHFLIFRIDGEKTSGFGGRGEVVATVASLILCLNPGSSFETANTSYFLMVPAARYALE
jgi:hypothetical protein